MWQRRGTKRKGHRGRARRRRERKKERGRCGGRGGKKGIFIEKDWKEGEERGRGRRYRLDWKRMRWEVED
jgi:hypothetical protein